MRKRMVFFIFFLLIGSMIVYSYKQIFFLRKIWLNGDYYAVEMDNTFFEYLSLRNKKELGAIIDRTEHNNIHFIIYTKGEVCDDSQGSMFEYFPNDIMYAVLDNSGNLMAFNNIDDYYSYTSSNNLKIKNLHIDIKDLFKIERANKAARESGCLY
ncbi:GAS domain-containing protein [Moraxella sp. Tifton1]|uniref:GAS domain-containing protein n=1 Tax=Moraxella oculi TaxID=2940516 RepID=UPI002011F17A|nr:GAS domain-containing protein [Moraxella sp. Tifton1]MCL1623832.1 GAS domain-containing protein [Moraxella sp. Tifton1]